MVTWKDILSCGDGKYEVTLRAPVTFWNTFSGIVTESFVSDDDMIECVLQNPITLDCFVKLPFMELDLYQINQEDSIAIRGAAEGMYCDLEQMRKKYMATLDEGYREAIKTFLPKNYLCEFRTTILSENMKTILDYAKETDEVLYSDLQQLDKELKAIAEQEE